MNDHGRAILALDLGTSAFKCGAVTGGRLLGEPVELPYDLDRRDGSVTLDDPERYARMACEALTAAARQAREAGVTVGAVGICSQAQTFVAVGARGDSVGPAVVWLDEGGAAEAEAMEALAPDWAARTGFPKRSGQQFLPKVRRVARGSGSSGRRFLLLNEFVLLRLTGDAYGDTAQQGMGGFYDISQRRWNEEYFRLAGIEEAQLAPAYPAARFARMLSSSVAEEIGAPVVPAYSCGNDQCCSAIGAGLRAAGEAVCNFGTAMVVYTSTPGQRTELSENQIAGIDPLTGGWFLLAYASECGSPLESARRERFPDGTIDDLIRSEDAEARALLDRLSDSFGELLSGLGVSSEVVPLVATGGLSRSAAWLDFLEKAHGVRFRKAAHEHTSLPGIAAVVAANAGNP